MANKRALHYRPKPNTISTMTEAQFSTWLQTKNSTVSNSVPAPITSPNLKSTTRKDSQNLPHKRNSARTTLQNRTVSIALKSMFSNPTQSTSIETHRILTTLRGTVLKIGFPFMLVLN
jgi:hypothetical protein